MVKRSDYAPEAVEACLSVMVEIVTLLGEFRDNVVLIGGWVPYFLFPEHKREHTGSMDIDLALDFRGISEESYRTILQLMEKQGYAQGKQPFTFLREIMSNSGNQIIVEVNLAAGEYGGTTKTHRTQIIQDVKARKTRGCDLVFPEIFLFPIFQIICPMEPKTRFL